MSNPFNQYPTTELELIALCLNAVLAKREDKTTRTKAEKNKEGTFELNGETHEVSYSVSVSKPRPVSDSKFGRRLATVLAFALAREQVNDVFNGEEADVSARVSSIIAEHGAFIGLDSFISPAIEAAYKVQRTTTFPSTIPKGRTSFHGVDQLVTEVDGQPCDKCRVYVSADYFCGNDLDDGTSEYLCPDCYTPAGMGEVAS